MRAIRCLIFSLSAAFWGQPALAVESQVETCSEQVSPRVRVVRNLIRSSLTLQVTTPEEVREFIESENAALPMTGEARDIGNLALRNKVRELIAKMADTELKNLKRELRQVLSHKSSEDQAVDEAREATQNVVNVKLLSPLAESLTKESFNATDWRPGRLHGRPVLYTVGIDDKKADVVVYDPFNTDENLRLVKLKKKWGRQGRPLFENLSLFQFEGTNYLGAFDVDYLYNLDEKREASPREIGVKSLQDVDPRDQLLLLDKTTAGFRVLIPVPGSQKHLEFDLGDSKLQSNLNPFSGYEAMDFHTVGQQQFVTSVSRKTSVYLYNVGGEVESRARLISHNKEATKSPHMYEHDGKTMLTFAAATDMPVRDWKIAKVDLQTGKVKNLTRTFKIRGNTRLIYIDGVPHLEFFTSTHLVKFNLITNRPQQTRLTQDYQFVGDVIDFTWSGRSFRIGINENLNPVLYEFETDSYIVHPRPRNTNALQIFEYQGGVYAMATFQDGMPQLLQIVGKEDK